MVISRPSTGSVRAKTGLDPIPRLLMSPDVHRSIPTTSAQVESALRKRFSGSIVVPTDEGYDQARRVWNGMIDRYPGVVLRPHTAADIVTGLSFAREQGLDVCVRGGGHSVAGFSTCDGGLVVDLRSMCDIRVDSARRRAIVGWGPLLGPLDAAAQEVG